MSHDLRQNALAEIQSIERKNNGVIPIGDVLEKARDKRSALHELYEWDINEAAERYWSDRTREIIRSYRVMVKVIGSDKPESVRAFVSLSTDRQKDGGYRSLTAVLDDEERREVMLEDALADLARFQKKYAVISELESVFVEIEKVLPLAKRPSKRSEERPAA